MALFILAIGLLLAGPAYGRECSGAVPNDVCEVGRPAPASASASSPAPEATGNPKPAPRSSKVHSAISSVVSAIEATKAAGSTEAVGGFKKLSTWQVRVNEAGEIQVYVILTEFSNANVATLEGLGLRVEVTLPNRRLVQGWVPGDVVDAIAALDFVQSVKPPSYPLRDGAGAVNTAGDNILGAASARSTFGVSGAGVKVGVISHGVDHLANSVQTNDLPAGVEVLKAGSGGDEGTAMLEIVHDIAPGASLTFYGPQTSADMVAGINALAAAGARVVVDDLSFVSEPKFEDGPIAEAVKNFATGGRVYVSSAGNRAQEHYRAPYNRLTGQNFPSDAYPAVHNYVSGTIDFGNTVVIPPFCSLRVVLQWNNPFGASADDFDLFIANSSNFEILAGSIEFQDGTQDPIEATGFTNTTTSPITVFIAVSEFQLTSPPGSLVLDYFAILDCAGALQYVTPSESLVGNHAIEEALPIAAVDALTPTQAEPYSSQGPGTTSFPPQFRNVPVLTGVDCVDTAAGALGFFALPFCGTSAAAAHVAGVAALLIERAPTLTSEQLRGVLTGTALDLGPPGFDFTYGFGRVDAFAALQFVSAGPHIQLGLTLDRHSVSPGQTLQLGFFEANTGAAKPLDFYFGVLVQAALSATLGCPAGDALIFFADSFARVVVVCFTTASPQTFAPLFSNMAVPAASPPTPVSGFSVLWPADVPGGTYTFIIFTTPPGAFADGNVGPADLSALAVDTLQASP